ncbi:MAG: ABC transporter ATP-binding protein [Thermodesulfobacteriota bacterium]
MIEVEGLTKFYRPEDGPVLAGISFRLEAGRTLSVIGPSGCGKTTLLYILAGLSPASAGRVLIGGAEHTDLIGRTSFVLQDFGLFPWKTVDENVALGLTIRGAPRNDRRLVVRELLIEMGLTGHERKYPAQLSGGQKQRVAIARALATRPDLLLLDEPFSSLDALTREHLQDTLLGLWQTRHLTWIIVTHSVEEAVFLGDRIMVLTDRPAQVGRMIVNPGFGRREYRSGDQYFEAVKQVRAAMSGNVSPELRAPAR